MNLSFIDHKLAMHLSRPERELYRRITSERAIRAGTPVYSGEDSLPIPELDGFCDYLTTPPRDSPRTWKTYATQADLFIRFTAAQGKDWKCVSVKDIWNYHKVRTTGIGQDGHTIQPVT